jgi:hypothetical protein
MGHGYWMARIKTSQNNWFDVHQLAGRLRSRLFRRGEQAA